MKLKGKRDKLIRRLEKRRYYDKAEVEGSIDPFIFFYGPSSYQQSDGEETHWNIRLSTGDEKLLSEKQAVN